MYKTNPQYILNELDYLKTCLFTYSKHADELINEAKFIDGSEDWFAEVYLAMNRSDIKTADNYCKDTSEDCKRFLAENNARGVQKCMNRIDAVRKSEQSFVASHGNPNDPDRKFKGVENMLDLLIGLIRHKAVNDDYEQANPSK